MYSFDFILDNPVDGRIKRTFPVPGPLLSADDLLGIVGLDPRSHLVMAQRREGDTWHTKPCDDGVVDIRDVDYFYAVNLSD